ncbi:MAG: gamma-glutamyltransferase [Saprospirales bacterium]|nr:gamma-glutamyltransferase [Saprospirales bacterium]
MAFLAPKAPVATSLLFVLLFAVRLYAQDRITGRRWATRSEVIAQNGMACTSHPLATLAAIDILKNGGTAIDAAIAANACLGLMEPTGSGIGGDLFAIVWDAQTQKLYGLNASGRSPKALTLDYFQKQGLRSIPSYGPLPVTAPGCVDGWFELHQRFGRLPMADILQPAIQYAEQGFPVTELVAYYLQLSVRRFLSNPNFKETYTLDGRAPEKGDLFRNPALANTYRLLAEQGRDAFYKGSIARTIDRFMREQGGFLAYDDLAAHRSEWVEPVSVNYRGYDVWELPPNGQGIAALQMLNILEGFEFGPADYGTWRHIHLFAEAKKLAFEDRAKYYADPAFSRTPVAELLHKEYAARRRALIRPDRANNQVAAGDPFANNTIYLTVADKAGNMISLIQSNYRGMGSGMVPPGLGFMLHDRGELFSLDPAHANVFAPGKRPFHTIIPAFITKDGQPFLSFGVMGGDFQPLGHVQIAMNIIDFQMNIQEAGDAPRIDHQGGNSDPTGPAAGSGEGGGQILLESGLDYETVRQLLQMGHKVGFGLGGYGGYQAIRWDPARKVYFGASESRKDGCAMGY